NSNSPEMEARMIQGFAPGLNPSYRAAAPSAAFGPQGSGLCEPALALRRIGLDHRAEQMMPDRGKTAECQGRRIQLSDRRGALEPAEIPGRCIQGQQQGCGTAFQQTAGPDLLF